MSTVKTKATYPQGGTGLDTLGTAGQTQVVNEAGTALEWGSSGHEGVDTYVASTEGYLTGGNSPSALSIFQTLAGGANDGAIKIRVDGIVYDNVFINLFIPYLITSPSYDSKSKDVTSEEDRLNDIAFNADGTKMFVIGFDSATVYQYTLSTAFDVSTATYDSVSKSVSAQDTSTQSIAFSTDGTKMFIAGHVSNDVFEYSLSTAWSLASASYVRNYSVSGELTCVRFNADGTKMFTVDDAGDNIYSYVLTTAWSLASVSYEGTVNVTSQDNSTKGVNFNADGTKMFVVGNQYDAVKQYSLPTPFTLSGATYDSVSFSISSYSTAPGNIRFNNDGTKMYLAGYQYNRVYQFSVGDTVASFDDVATEMQTAIREETGTNEIVEYDTDHFIISSASVGTGSEILKLMTPTSGTDLSGLGATIYLDCATNATETAGTGNNGKVAVLNNDGKIDAALLATPSFYDKVQVFTGNAPTTDTVLDLSSYTGEREALVMLTVTLTGNPNVDQWQAWFYHKSDSSFAPVAHQFSSGGSNFAVFYAKTTTDQSVQVITRTNSSGEIYWRGYSATGVTIYIEEVI